ncbi:enoyl-CoA hydratase [Enemella dayhoffiae]|uniref:Enoyl-CoA hydratase n=1 Tax=Enemella dayhoffiae TaxID=2016507 RepID=A0A255H524_9ACTN|nr:enoyl-CoA hydratase-related protein [Enemella dayhoffiae]OYO21644.1 enoyl-CoA hydratase [Enemella dayhoffiae]
MALVDYEYADGAAWLTLDNPDAGNAITFESTAELAAAVRRAERDGARVIVLRSTGRFFSVGGDLAGFAQAEDMPAHMDDLATAIHRVIAGLQRNDAVVVTVVQGPAAGIGFPLAAAGDLVLASDRAKFTLGYTKVGLAGDGGTGLLTRTLGLHRTLRLALLNDLVGAEEAYAAGLVARVFPADELDAKVRELVAGLAAGSATAQAAAKHLIRAAAGDDVEARLAAEARAMTSAAGTPDAVEGIDAFLGKRPAKFGGDA